MSRTFSPCQLAYMTARAAFEAARQDKRAYDRKIDCECALLGIDTPYGILPENHPMLATAQALLDVENAASARMYTAARTLFDWATESALARMGTPQQKADVRAMVAKVKRMAFVEKPFIELVDLCMRLAA